MGHFFGFIQGNRGDATRMGSKDSGFTAWAQGWKARVSILLFHEDGKDGGRISIEGGPSSHSGGHLPITITDLPQLVEGLGIGSEAIHRRRLHIQRQFELLERDCAAAVRRERRRLRGPAQ